MNALQTDIITILARNGAMKTADICDKLAPLGYGGMQTFDEFKSHITKTISKMKAEHKVIGEDRPTPGSKPVRYWSLPEAAEMESDVAEVEQSQPPAPSPLVDFLIAEAEREPEFEMQFKATPENTAWKELLPSKPMSAAKILKEFANCGFDDDRPLGAFLDGIAAAERYHRIAE